MTTRLANALSHFDFYDEANQKYAPADEVDEADRGTIRQEIMVDIPAFTHGTTHGTGNIGAIGTVYGGGNQAKVEGDTYVEIGTKETIDFETKDADATSTETQPRTGVAVKGANIKHNVYGGGNQATVTGQTHVIIGKGQEEKEEEEEDDELM